MAKSLRALVGRSREDLKRLYHLSPFNIITQQKRKPFNEVEWHDFLELLKLGHYAATTAEIQETLAYFDKFAQRQVKNLSEIEPQSGDVIRHLTERLHYVQPPERLPLCG